MQIRIPPPVKGLITALLMVAVFLFVYRSGKDSGSSLQFLIYGLYGAGIIWTLIAYRRSDAFTGKFGGLFNQGFRCFVVVTLCMAVFYGVFNYMHPEFAEETAAAYREQMIKANEKVPVQIESEIATFKKQYPLKLVSGAIFGYLIIGAGVTALLSALLTKRNS